MRPRIAKLRAVCRDGTQKLRANLTLTLESSRISSTDICIIIAKWNRNTTNPYQVYELRVLYLFFFCTVSREQVIITSNLKSRRVHKPS